MLANVGARILIVDDEPAVVRLLKMVLDSPEWTLETAATAEEALARAPEPPVDLYLVDKNLPGASGLDLLRERRRRGDDAAAILITGYASSASAFEAANLGIDAYLEKPFPDVFQVTGTVKRVLEARLRRKRVAAALAPKKDSAFTPLKILVAFRSPDGRARVSAAIDRRDQVAQAATRAELIDALKRGGVDVLILEGSVGVADVVEEVRRAAAAVPCVVVGERLPLAVVKRLIDLEVRNFVDGQVAGAEGKQRLDDAIERCRARKLIQELR